MTDKIVKENDNIVLIPKNKKSKITFKIIDKIQKISGLGVYNPIKLLGENYGRQITLGANKYWLLPANTLDHLETMKRKAQIIIPKDAALIGLYCDIHAGSNVVEGGLGSGALTIILLKLVGPKGIVTTYEARKDFAKIGKENIEKANLQKQWQLKIKDITTNIVERDQDAVVLDIPEPWSAVDEAYTALRSGGMIAGYLPTITQVEKFVEALQNKPFINIFTFETLQRELIVRSGAIRPGFDMLGHTGYITVGRKVLDESNDHK
jgi:tRNA (adenine57-N1/adenine58-N1)-methyltransferase